MKANATVAQIKNMVIRTRKEAVWIAENMPKEAKTQGQIDLMAKHGTPYSFAMGVIECIGEISILEAQTSAEKYLREWNAAK